jgi:EF-hand domain pair
MKLCQFVSLVTVLFVAAGTLRAQAPAGDAPASNPPADEAASKPSKRSQKTSLKLPEEYRSKDKDNDNQIGMYEWPKSEWAKFRELDLNGDGFLTAKELTHKPKSSRSSRGSRSDRGGSSRGESSRPEVASSGSSTTSTEEKKSEPAGPATTLSNTETEKQAERFFGLADKDGNGRISEDEVKGSAVVKLKFGKLPKPPTYPLSRDEFIRTFVEASNAAK